MDTLRPLRTTRLFRFPHPVAGTRSRLHRRREVDISLPLTAPCNHLGKRYLFARAVVKFSHPAFSSPPIILGVAQRRSSPKPLLPLIILPDRDTQEVSFSPPISNFLRRIITADQVLADDCCLQKLSERVTALYSKSLRLPRLFFHARRCMTCMHVG